MAAQIKNVTFSLPTDLVDKYREYAKDKSSPFPSLNAGVREALEEYINKIEKEKLRREMRQASSDPMFMDDLNESMADFAALDVESARKGDY